LDRDPQKDLKLALLKTIEQYLGYLVGLKLDRQSQAGMAQEQL